MFVPFIFHFLARPRTCVCMRLDTSLGNPNSKPLFLYCPVHDGNSSGSYHAYMHELNFLLPPYSHCSACRVRRTGSSDSRIFLSFSRSDPWRFILSLIHASNSSNPTAMTPLLFQRQPTTDDRRPEIRNAAIGFLAAAIFVGGLRLGLRVRRRILSWDDAAISISIVWTLCASFCCTSC